MRQVFSSNVFYELGTNTMFLMKCLRKKNHWCWGTLEYEDWREVQGVEGLREKEEKGLIDMDCGGIRD